MVLADGLIELMKTKPFKQITVKELCDLANVHRSTFYIHYEDIYALLRAVEDDSLAWVYASLNELSGTYREGDEAFLCSLERLSECFAKNTQLQVLMSEQGDINFQKQVFNAGFQLRESSNVQNSKLAMPLTENLHYIFMVGGCINIVQHWLKNGLKESPQEIARVVYDMSVAVR
jgi:AcrR family transcriptional regulator